MESICNCNTFAVNTNANGVAELFATFNGLHKCWELWWPSLQATCKVVTLLGRVVYVRLLPYTYWGRGTYYLIGEEGEHVRLLPYWDGAHVRLLLPYWGRGHM